MLERLLKRGFTTSKVADCEVVPEMPLRSHKEFIQVWSDHLLEGVSVAFQAQAAASSVWLDCIDAGDPVFGTSIGAMITSPLCLLSLSHE